MLTHLSNKELQIPSIPSNLTQVEALIDELRDELSIGEEVYGNILIAITEAVNNAITHGNDCDEQKLVTLSVSEEEGRLKFVIQDEGEGFDFNHLPDPTAPENIEKPSGRGVFLIKNLADLMVFSNEGSRLEVFFRL